MQFMKIFGKRLVIVAAALLVAATQSCRSNGTGPSDDGQIVLIPAETGFASACVDTESPRYYSKYMIRILKAEDVSGMDDRELSGFIIDRIREEADSAGEYFNDYVKTKLLAGNLSGFFRSLDPSCDYVVAAYYSDDKGNPLGEISRLEISTEALPDKYDMRVVPELGTLLQDSAEVSTFPSRQHDPYSYVLAEAESIEGQDYGQVVAEVIGSGVQMPEYYMDLKTGFGGLEPSKEYVFLTFGYYRGHVTTDISSVRFRTCDRAVLEDVSFSSTGMEAVMPAHTAMIRTVPSDPRAYYVTKAVKADGYDPDEVISRIEEELSDAGGGFFKENACVEAFPDDGGPDPASSVLYGPNAVCPSLDLLSGDCVDVSFLFDSAACGTDAQACAFSIGGSAYDRVRSAASRGTVEKKYYPLEENTEYVLFAVAVDEYSGKCAPVYDDSFRFVTPELAYSDAMYERIPVAVFSGDEVYESSLVDLSEKQARGRCFVACDNIFNTSAKELLTQIIPGDATDTLSWPDAEIFNRAWLRMSEKPYTFISMPYDTTATIATMAMDPDGVFGRIIRRTIKCSRSDNRPVSELERYVVQ